jgi:hypothetical protein
MLNLVQSQKDIYQLLLASTQLANVNIVLQRQLQLQSSLDITTVWTTPRNGYAGAGCIVEMPTARFNESSVRGPILDWVFSVWVLEVPLLNFALPTTGRAAQGTQIACEEIVQMVLDEIHHYADDNLATFEADPSPVAPANLDKIALGYRVNFLLKKARSPQTTRTGQVQVTLTTGHFALADAIDSGSTIYFTLDGSFPGASNIGSDPAYNLVPQSTNYSGGGTYTLTGLTVGFIYYWSPGLANDTSLVNGSQTLTTAGAFTAQGTTVTLHGTVSAQINAQVGAAAQIYGGGTVAAPTGLTLRARAYISGKTGSATAFGTIT